MPFEVDAKECKVKLLKLTERGKACVSEDTAEKLIDRGWGVTELEMELYLIETIQKLNEAVLPGDPGHAKCSMLIDWWAKPHYVHVRLWSDGTAEKRQVWECMGRTVPLAVEFESGDHIVRTLTLHLYHPSVFPHDHRDSLKSCESFIAFNLTDGSPFCPNGYRDLPPGTVMEYDVPDALGAHIKDYTKARQDCGFLDYPLFDAFESRGDALLLMWQENSQQKDDLLECIRQLDGYGLLSNRI